MRQFEQSKGIDRNGFVEYPKCYRTIDIESNESIILEDLAHRSVTTIDFSTGTITADHVNLVMRSFAKLHSLSFSIQDQQPKKLKELVSNFTEPILVNDNLNLHMKQTAQLILESVSSEEDAHLLARAEHFLKKDPKDIIFDCWNLNQIHSVAAILHGDASQNNFMFKCDHDGTPNEICILDWQTSRYASPILDIVHFMFLCTTKKLRDVHYESFL